MRLKTTIFFAITAMLASTSLYAQEQLQHEKKVVKNENGTIYWQADLPVYFFISTDPDGKADLIKLTKGNADKYTNPYFFDTEGTNFIRTRYAVDPVTKQAVVPQLEVEFEVERDKYAPATSLSFSSAPKHVSSGKVFYGKGLNASLSSKDYLSGVEKTFYSTNTAAYTEYSSAVDFGKEGDYTFSYYAVDAVGNPEEPNTKIFTVDTTPPVSSHEITGDHLEGILSPRSVIALSSNDNSSGVKYTFYQYEESTQAVYGKSLTMYNLQDGEHTLSYQAKDNVENEETMKTYSFYLDKIAPKVRSEILGARHSAGGKVFIAGSTKIKLSAIDNKAGLEDIYYSINGGEYVKYDSPFLLDKPQGAGAVSFYAIDKVKNKGKAATDDEVGNLYLDLTAPKLSYSYKGAQFFDRDTMFITSATEVILKASDYESGVNKISYQVNSGSESTYDNPFTLPTEGLQHVDYSGEDNVTNKRSDKFYVVVDNKGPEVFYHLSMDAIGSMSLKDQDKPIPVFASHTQLYLAATDELVGTDKIYYTLDGGKEILYTSPLKTDKKGLRELQVRAVDKLGNETKSELIKIVIQ
ncbi:MAG: hypothetical protein CMO01_16120 [Thalassobius sp.]|nr:hypothetical protein [Thalassovita sp.]